ncbi:ankyrin repeat domain-containing protein [bacterium]|nr:ankyrin repeat domain-containing protein [bacterium]
MPRVLLVVVILLVWACPVLAAPIHEAAHVGDLEQLERLLAADPALIDMTDEHQATALHYAADLGAGEAIALLIEHGANLKALDADGDTPLHWAAMAGQTAAVQALVAAGAQVDPHNHQGQTPLHYAAIGGHPRVAKMLLNLGAAINAPNAEGQTPLHEAALHANSEVLVLLAENGADLELQDSYGRTALVLMTRESGDVATALTLISSGADIDSRDKFGDNSLRLAAWRGFTGMVELLLDHEAEIELAEDGDYLLEQAADRGLERLFFRVLELAESQDVELTLSELLLFNAAAGGSGKIMQALLDQGLDPNYTDGYGSVPLHRTAMKGRLDCAEALVAAGADINRLNRLGETAYNIALAWEQTAYATRLAELGADPSAQRFPELRGPYLGQEPPGLAPQRFARGIVDLPGMEHTCIVFTPGLDEAFWPAEFMLEDSGYSISKLMTARIEDGRWTAPELMEFSRDMSYGDTDPCLAPDGNRLYFYSRRPVEPGRPANKENVWYSDRIEDGWTEPRSLGAAANEPDTHWEIGADQTGNVYVGATDGRGYGGGDIYVIEQRDGVFQAPVNMGVPVNGPGGDGQPYIAPDGSFLLLTRFDGEGSLGGPDLYMSERLADGGWSEPENLGMPVNSDGYEICPTITPDGKYLFFLGRRELGDGIYWVDIQACPQLAELAQGVAWAGSD